VRYVGISEAGPDDIRAAHAVCPLTAVQLEWSLWSRWGLRVHSCTPLRLLGIIIQLCVFVICCCRQVPAGACTVVGTHVACSQIRC
jgi:hypothetical protein